MTSAILVSEAGGAFRNVATETLRILIEEREGLGKAIDVDREAAQAELREILDGHALALSELTINGAFDLIEMQRGSVYDPEIYAEVIRQLDDAQLAAEAEAIADRAAVIVGQIQRRKALIESLAIASQSVVRGVLSTALIGGLAAAGLPIIPVAPPVAS